MPTYPSSYYQRLAESASNTFKGTTGTPVTTINDTVIPKGGSVNQILSKNSNKDYDVKWITSAKSTGSSVAGSVPTGGTANQVLEKIDGTDYNTQWTTLAGGGDMLAATYDPTTIAGDAFARANHTGTQTAATVSDFDTEVSNNASVAANTAKDTNVSTNLSEGTSTTTTVDVNSSDGTNATLVSASTSRAGLLTKAKWDEIVANTAKVSYPTKDSASFYLSTGGFTGMAAVEQTVVINNTAYNSDGAVFTLATNEVTINKTGVFMFTGDVGLNQDPGTSRSEYQIWLTADTVEVTGSRASVFVRGFDSGSSASFTIIVSVTSGEDYRIRVDRVNGASTTTYQTDYASRLTITEL